MGFGQKWNKRRNRSTELVNRIIVADQSANGCWVLIGLGIFVKGAWDQDQAWLCNVKMLQQRGKSHKASVHLVRRSALLKVFTMAKMCAIWCVSCCEE